MLYFCNLIFFLKKEYKIKLDNVAQNIDVKKPYNPKIIIWKKSIIDPGIGKEYKISDERITIIIEYDMLIPWRNIIVLIMKSWK